MAGLKEIARRLKSVKNTKKITYAMKLVSAAKLRKAQDGVAKAREYTDALTGVLVQVIKDQSGSELSHPLLEQRAEVKRIRLIVVGGSRGLCGGYNANIFRKVEQLFREKSKQLGSVQAIDSVLVGKKSGDYYRRTQRGYVLSFEQLPESPANWPIDQICKNVEDAFIAGEIDQVYIVYTKFRSAMSMSVNVEQLLPFDSSLIASTINSGSAASEGQSSGKILFEPSASEVFAQLLPRILRARVLQAGLDARASEHGSRMTAMESATKNASELIRKLQLTHNKLRQLSITSQLLDIVGGAEALN